MAEKSIKVNLMLSRSLWDRLHRTSSMVGYSRASFIRLVLEGAANSKNPSMYVPSRVQSWMGAVNAPPVSAPAAPTVRTPAPTAAPPKTPAVLFPGEEVPKLKDETRFCSSCFSVVEKTDETCASCGRPYVDEIPEKYTPGEYEIPADWVNEYGMTVEQQNARYEDDYLEYRPAHKWLMYKTPESY